MRWSTCCRTVAALLAAWSFVVEDGPAALHTCAVHDGAVHVTEATHHSPNVVADDPQTQQHHDGSRHSRCCTCLGPCCDASPVALLRTAELLVATTIDAAAPLSARPTTYIPSAPEHSRPPSVGPPHLHIG